MIEEEAARVAVPTRRRVAQAALVAGGTLLAAMVLWVLGPGAAWWLENVDGLSIGGPDGLKGKALAEALDTVRGRAMTGPGCWPQ
jgi:hypothetical protein